MRLFYQTRNEDTTFRPFYLRQDNTVYSSVYRYDDIHVDIRCGRRLFRFQLCRGNSLCRGKFHNAFPYDTRNCGLILLSALSLSMVILSELLALPLSTMFVGKDPVLFDMTVGAFRIYSFSFLFMGIAIFASGFFTALGDGLTSALISFLRTLVFQVLAVLLLPLIFELDGIWYSMILSEAMAVVLSFIFIAAKRKTYGY